MIGPFFHCELGKKLTLTHSLSSARSLGASAGVSAGGTGSAALGTDAFRFGRLAVKKKITATRVATLRAEKESATRLLIQPFPVLHEFAPACARTHEVSVGLRSMEF